MPRLSHSEKFDSHSSLQCFQCFNSIWPFNLVYTCVLHYITLVSKMTDLFGKCFGVVNIKKIENGIRKISVSEVWFILCNEPTNTHEYIFCCITY
jgi:hypothetical protein